MVVTPRGPIGRARDAVAAGRLSATALTETVIGRLERHNPSLNLLAESTFDEALVEANRFDSNPSPLPLAGVPTLIKDLTDLADHATRQGSLALSDVSSAQHDGLVTKRLRSAGAIVVGKSTLPEFAIEGFTANLLTGITRNPWNPQYSTGGSCGGSAAALSAGLALVATATDGGGAIRIPASMCGLVGLKPTNGVIGRWPAHDWFDYSTDGPFATSVDDLALLLSVLAGPVAGDPTAPPRAALERPTDPRPLNLFAAERTSPLGPLPDPVARIFRESVEAFGTLYDAPVVWLEAEGFFTGGDPDLDWFTVTTAEHVTSLGRQWVRDHMDEFHVATQEFLMTGLEVSIERYLHARRRRFDYVRTIDQLLGRDGLLLTPTVASEGWLADGRLSTDSEVHGLPPHVYSTAMQNVTGNPALSLPFRRHPTGLPFGLQVTAPHFEDLRLLEVARDFESAFPWVRFAPGYEDFDFLNEF